MPLFWGSDVIAEVHLPSIVYTVNVLHCVQWKYEKHNFICVCFVRSKAVKMHRYPQHSRLYPFIIVFLFSCHWSLPHWLITGSWFSFTSASQAVLHLWRVKIERVLNQNRKWGYLSNDFKCKLFLFPVGLTLHGGNTQTSHLKGQHRPGLLAVMKLKNKIHFSASLRHKQSGKKQKKTN